jgi:asparagine synthase (glutamine-hydrolysing)
MCGIAGFFGVGDEAILRRMTAAIAHRGPDDEAFFVDAARGVWLGFRRLAILDLVGGKQPMQSEDGALTVVFNGQIYNHRELRAELTARGARFVTDHSDTEVLLHGYRQWGEALLDRLNGMWAFALYDRERRRVFFARDRFGKKPLFYYAGRDVFAFASELTALRQHPAIPGRLSLAALRKYFAYGYVPAPRTFLENVYKLPAGHALSLDLAELRPHVRRYWQYRPEPEPQDEATCIEEFRARLGAAVARRLAADVPVGCFLSGGIDSSVVAALAARQVGRERIRAFSIGFDEKTFDESPYARRVAQHIGAEHALQTLTLQQAAALLPAIAAHWDEPIADASLLPTYLLCCHARRYATVALGGDGADELLAGYDPFRALAYARWYEKLVPRPVHRAVSLFVARLPVSHRYMSLEFRLKRMLRGLEHAQRLWLPVWMAPLAPAELAELFDAPLDLEELFSEAIEAWDDCVSVDPVERTIAFYLRLYLQDDILVKVDRASMLHSLEVRAPFLDFEVVEFLRRLPTHMKFRRGTTKWILRRCAATLLPRSVLRRRKQGFAAPLGVWLREGVLPRVAPRFAPDFWAAREAQHRRGIRDQRQSLFASWILAASHLGGLSIGAV